MINEENKSFVNFIIFHFLLYVLFYSLMPLSGGSFWRKQKPVPLSQKPVIFISTNSFQVIKPTSMPLWSIPRMSDKVTTNATTMDMFIVALQSDLCMHDIYTHGYTVRFFCWLSHLCARSHCEAKAPMNVAHLSYIKHSWKTRKNWFIYNHFSPGK